MASSTPPRNAAANGAPQVALTGRAMKVVGSLPENSIARRK